MLSITNRKCRLDLSKLKGGGVNPKRDWYKGWHFHSLNLLKTSLSDFCKQLIMETGEDVYLRLWQRSRKLCMVVRSGGNEPSTDIPYISLGKSRVLNNLSNSAWQYHCFLGVLRIYRHLLAATSLFTALWLKKQARGFLRVISFSNLVTFGFISSINGSSYQCMELIGLQSLQTSL